MRELNERDSVIDLLYRIRVIGHEATDADKALEEILEIVQQYFNATAATIALINPDTRELETEVNRGMPEAKDYHLPLGVGITGWVALHGKALYVADVSKDSRYLKVSDTIQSELACPMEEHSQTIGVVSIASTHLDSFSETVLKALQLIADEITRVVSQLWLIRQLRTRSEQLESLISMGQDLVSTLDMDQLLESTTRETKKILNCKLSMVLMVDENQGVFKIHSIEGASQNYELNRQISIDETTIGVAVNLRKQIEVIDIRKSEETHFWDIVNKEGLVSMICSPIIRKDEVLGILIAYSNKVHRFNNDEKRILDTLATFSGVAIQNQRLYSHTIESEEQLRHNDKLITLGMLAAEIAHEIRNPLTVIKLLFGSLGLEFDEGDERQTDIKVIEEKFTQLEEIVERVLNFGKTSQTMHSQWELQKLLEETIHLVRLKLENNKVEIHVEEHPTSLAVEAHKGQLQQVILNLILNATQAMPDGGKISFKLYSEHLHEQKNACLEITDTGKGISTELQNSVFDSFLSGRPGGTGLGLSIVKRILRAHRGDIQVKASDTHGTTMKFWLPMKGR